MYKENTFLGLSKSGIYKLTLPNGRFYIGQAKNIKKRLQSYKFLKCHTQVEIHQFILENGFDALCYEVLEFCNINKLFEREIYYISILRANKKRYPENNGINSTDGGPGSHGFKHTPEAVLKIVERKRGKVNSEESNRKRSQTQKGRPPHANLIKAITGKKQSVDHVNKRALCSMKSVIDLSTGVVYNSVMDAAKENGFSRVTLAGWLRGDYENRTNLRYLAQVKADKEKTTA